MKVLQIGLSYNPGGIESCIMDYYRQLAKKQIQFDFICMYKYLAHQEEIQALGGRIFYLPDVKKSPLNFRRRLTELLEREQYDVVHVNMLSAANVVPLAVARKAGVKKVIAHSHNSSTPGILRNVLHKINKRLIPRYATEYFACSKMAGEWLFPPEILKSNRFVLIHNAINLANFLHDQEAYKTVRKEMNLEDKWLFGHIGRFEEQKNHTLLIDIFNKISQRDENAVLLLIGEGELYAEIKKKTAELKLTDKVRFLGIRNDVARLLKGMDIFLLPSLFEGLPIVAVEAQAAGLYSFLSDTISKEVQIADKVEFIKLSDTPDMWCERILKQRSYSRGQAENERIMSQFHTAGYTIEAAGDRMLALYRR